MSFAPVAQRHQSKRTRTRGDTVTVKRLRVRQLLALPLCLLPDLLRLLGRSEPTAPLLVHLRPRGHTVDGHKEQLLGLDLAKKMIDIRKDGREDLFFG